MKSEELEQSLRAEFEGYLKESLLNMRREFSQLHEKIEDEIEKHKLQLDTVFEQFSSEELTEVELDAAFRDSVTEHLRLAKDEGARITASAIAEAEKLNEVNEKPADYSVMRSAVNDIFDKTTQSTILKALIHNASQFTPHGAFFIIKNEHFVGWRVFGSEVEDEEQSIRDLYFPVSDNTILGAAVSQLKTVEGSATEFSDDLKFLHKLGFEDSSEAIAIPLVARGRGVAVLYASTGKTGSTNVDAVETLVTVAGKAVELLASGAPVKPKVAYEAADESEQNNFVAPTTFTERAEELKAVEPEENTESSSNFPTFGVAALGTAGAAAVAVSEFSSEEPTAEIEPEETAGEFASDFTEVSETPVSSNFSTFVPEPEPTANDFAFATPEPISEEVSPESAFTDFSYSAPAEFENPVAAPSEVSDFEFSTNSEVAEPSLAEESAFEVTSDESYSIDADDFGVKTGSFEVENSTPSLNEFDFKSSYDFDTKPEEESSVVDFESTAYTVEETSAVDESAFSSFKTSDTAVADLGGWEPEPSTDYFNTGTATAIETPSFEPPTYEEPVAVPEPTPVIEEVPAISDTPTPDVQPAAAVAVPRASRFGDRNVDLPIDVPEEERRHHNDARRFARLLVSEIKLYNEQKVKEGRENQDLYERLREAIDRSREMYEKRVQPPVAQKFDYFHFEVVNTLAEGDDTRLGGSYPGAQV